MCIWMDWWCGFALLLRDCFSSLELWICLNPICAEGRALSGPGMGWVDGWDCRWSIFYGFHSQKCILLMKREVLYCMHYLELRIRKDRESYKILFYHLNGVKTASSYNACSWKRLFSTKNTLQFPCLWTKDQFPLSIFPYFLQSLPLLSLKFTTKTWYLLALMKSAFHHYGK